MRTLPSVLPLLFVAALAAGGALADQHPDDPPEGWRVTLRRLEGSERRPWYLALVFHKTPKVCTMIVAPADTAGGEGEGIDVERIERSATGDLHQIAGWAEWLRQEAEGWRRPSLRERPPASAHVIGVVRAVQGGVSVENAEHGGDALAVGDFVFVEDVVSGGRGFALELVGPENNYHFRTGLAALRCPAQSKIGLRGTSQALRIHLHEGVLEGRTEGSGLTVVTDEAEYGAGPESVFLLRRKGDERLDLRDGTVLLKRDGTSTTLAGGAAVELGTGAEQRIRPLDEPRWMELLPDEPACTRDEALRIVERACGSWQAQQLNGRITLRDDGTWTSYERHPGRSVNKGGSWEPRPGGLLELTHVWTPHRSKTARTDVYRYLLDGDVLRRLVPAGAVYLKP